MELNNFITNKKKKGRFISQKRIDKMQSYVKMASDFGEELDEETFEFLLNLELSKFEREENRYRSKKADLVLKCLPNDEQAMKVRRYTKRLYKWLAVYINEEQVRQMYKMSDVDMHKRYLKLAKEG